MIYFEGYQQLYLVEELTLESAIQLLEKQLINVKEVKESAEHILNSSYSYGTNKDTCL